MELPVKYDSLNNRQKKMVREEYVNLQGGLCIYCRNALSDSPTAEVESKPIRLDIFPPGFLDNPVHLQHSHTTGLTEGAVHAYCNAVMWQYDKR